MTITQENGRQQQQTRAGLLMLNVVHNNETYGSMVDDAAHQEHLTAAGPLDQPSHACKCRA